MGERRLEIDPHLQDLVLRTPPNWTAIGFLAALSLVHLSIATMSFLREHWEGYLSLALGVVFAVAALACWMSCCEIAIRRTERRVRLRSGYRRLSLERSIPFEHVQAVRLMLASGNHPTACRIELSQLVVCR